MWDTSEGERRLTGKERCLLIEGVLDLFWHLEEDAEDVKEGGHPSWVGEVALFDALPMSARPYALLATAQHLLDAGPAPKEEFWQEAAILATYYHLQGKVEVEIDTEKMMEPEDDKAGWRRLVLEAWKERYGEDEEPSEWGPDEGPNQDETSDNLAEWKDKIVFLAEAVLDDWDVELTQLLNIPAEVARCPRFTEHDEARLLKFRDSLIMEVNPGWQPPA